jgi:hypothetical protein
MDREQRRHEKHEHERHEKQAHERGAEQHFSEPGPTIHPHWFLVLGIVLVLGVIAVWVAIAS